MILSSLKKNCFILEKTLLEHLRELFYRTQMELKYMKNQIKNQTKTNILRILRMNQKVLTMICLKNILNLKYLLSWQKHYLKQQIKNNNELVSAINSGLIDFKKEIEKMSKEEKK